MENRENYLKLMSLCERIENEGEENEIFCFNWDGFIRLVDYLFNEGKLAELLLDPDYADDAKKIGRLQEYETQLSQAIPTENTDEEDLEEVEEHEVEFED